MVKLPKSPTLAEKRAKRLIEYMVENYPDYHYSESVDWAECRIFELVVTPNIIITVDADFNLDDIGQLVTITIRFVLEELLNTDWGNITVEFA